MENSQKYNISFSDLAIIETTVTADSSVAESWAVRNSTVHPKFAGLELKVYNPTGGTAEAVVLQLCIQNQCLVYLLGRAAQPFPPALRALVGDKGVLFVGRTGIGDRVQILGVFGLQVGQVLGVNELLMRQPRYVPENSFFSDFNYMVCALLGDDQLKKLLPTLDGWEAEDLSVAHVKAAATEVFALKEVAERLSK